METKAKKSRLARIPAWALSVITIFIVIIPLVITNDPKSTGLGTPQIAAWIIYIVLVTVASFVICRTHPKSVWYTPLICNAICVMGLIVNSIASIIKPDFISATEWILLVCSFVFSIAGAIIGARTGRRRTNQTT